MPVLRVRTLACARERAYTNAMRRATSTCSAIALFAGGVLSMEAGVATFDEALARATNGDAEAEVSLGIRYAKGDGVAKDFETAVKWFRQAAEHDNAVGQCNLGVMFATGQGVPQDYVSAHMWFNLSAARGQEGAAKNRDSIAARMTPAQVAEAQKLAREWQPKRP